MIKITLIIVCALFTFACSEQRMTRLEWIHQTDAYLERFYQRILNYIDDHEYSFLHEKHGGAADPWEEIIIFDSEKLQGVLMEPKGEAFVIQFQKMIQEQPNISYVELTDNLKTQSFKFNVNNCPSIQEFPERFKKAQLEATNPNPPTRLLLGERNLVTFKTGELIVDGELKSYRTKVTIESGFQDEPLIKEFLEFLTVIQACKNQAYVIN